MPERMSRTQAELADTLFHKAIQYDSPELVQLLLDYKADPSKQNHVGETALDAADKRRNLMLPSYVHRFCEEQEQSNDLEEVIRKLEDVDCPRLCEDIDAAEDDQRRNFFNRLSYLSKYKKHRRRSPTRRSPRRSPMRNVLVGPRPL